MTELSTEAGETVMAGSDPCQNSTGGEVMKAGNFVRHASAKAPPVTAALVLSGHTVAIEISCRLPAKRRLLTEVSSPPQFVQLGTKSARPAVQGQRLSFSGRNAIGARLPLNPACVGSGISERPPQRSGRSGRNKRQAAPSSFQRRA